MATSTACPPKLSGSARRAAAAREHFMFGVMKRLMHGRHTSGAGAVRSMDRFPLDSIRPTPSAFMTSAKTFTNGARIGSEEIITLTRRREIRAVRNWASGALLVEVHGATRLK